MTGRSADEFPIRLVVFTIFSHLFLYQYAQAVPGSQQATGMTLFQNMQIRVSHGLR